MNAYNGYTFASRKALREALKFYTDLAACAAQGDTTSAAILVDLNAALSVLAPRQRQAIELHLVANIPAPAVADRMGVITRAVYYSVDEGLVSILRYFATGRVTLWPSEQVEFVKRNCGELTDAQLGERIGRTAQAVSNMLWRLRSSGEELPRRASRRVA